MGGMGCLEKGMSRNHKPPKVGLSFFLKTRVLGGNLMYFCRNEMFEPGAELCDFDTNACK